MKVSVHINKHTNRKRIHTEYALRGLERLGMQVSMRDINDTPDETCDFALAWGHKHTVNTVAGQIGMPVLILERPYYGNRGYYISLAWNKPGRLGIRPPPPNTLRAEEHQPTVRPWRDPSDPGIITVFGQVPSDVMVQGRNLDDWYTAARVRASAFWQRTAAFRPHPQVLKPRATLQQVLDTTWLGITFNSTTGVDCVLAGVPAVTVDAHAMAWDVTGHSIDHYTRPERDEWAHWLSYCQWSPTELADGRAIAHMLQSFYHAKEEI